MEWGFDLEEINEKKNLKILLCNGAFIGDWILSTTVLPLLKQQFPHCQIGVLAGSWAECVVKDHALIDWIHLFDQSTFNRRMVSKKIKKLTERITYKRAIEEVRSINYDIVFDLHSYYKENSSHFIYETKIPLRVGFVGPSRTPFFFNRLLRWEARKFHMMENHHRMMHECGIESSQVVAPCLEYRIPPPTLSLPENYFVVHMGTGQWEREWSDAKWKRVITRLDSYGYPLLFIGRGEKEKKRIEKLTSSSKHALDFGDKFSFKELIQVVKNARFLLGLESMAGHLAAFHRIPALLIYAAETPIDWRPYSPTCQVIRPKKGYNWKWEQRMRRRAITTITSRNVMDRMERILVSKKLI